MENTQVRVVHNDQPKVLRDLLNVEVSQLSEMGFTIVSIENHGDTFQIWYE